MTSVEQQAVCESHHAIKGLMLLIDGHSNFDEIKPDQLYFLLDPVAKKLQQLLIADGLDQSRL